MAAATSTSLAGTLAGFPDFAAVVQVPEIGIHRQPGDAESFLRLPKVTGNGAPQTMLIDAERPAASDEERWFRVLLPVRPNGTQGWVRASEVVVVGLPYRLVIDIADFRLDVFEGDALLRSITIGVGTDQTPTPGGRYYIKELLRPPNQNTLYGHYVFGLSGFSNVLVDWPDGGVLGIHGSNDQGKSLRQKISHGCIRMVNADIEYLAKLLPLGTPVEVQA